MKRLLPLLLIPILAAPVFASDNSARIKELQEQIATLQAELDQLQTESIEQASDTLSASGKKFKMTAIKGYTLDSASYIGEIRVPAEGNVFIVIDLEVENISNEDLYFNWLNFASFLDGYAISIDYKQDYALATGDVMIGKKLIGSVGYEVPADWKEIEINYKESDFTEKSTIKITVPSDSPIFY